MQLRRLETVKLVKATRTTNLNGSTTETYADVAEYKVIFAPIRDAVSASVYGANINKMYSVSSVLSALETYLLGKINTSSDNISLYYIVLNNVKYKINAVTKEKVEIEYTNN